MPRVGVDDERSGDIEAGRIPLLTDLQAPIDIGKRLALAAALGNKEHAGNGAEPRHSSARDIDQQIADGHTSASPSG